MSELRQVQKNRIVSHSKYLLDSTQLEGLLEKINGDNKKIAVSINELIADAHVKCQTNAQYKHYNLLRDIIEGDDKYEYLLKVIYDSDFKSGVEALITQSLQKNIELTENEKRQITAWFKELLEEDDIQKRLVNKITVVNDSAKGEITKADVVEIRSKLVTGILTNGKVIGRINGCISRFQRSLNSQSYQKILSDINKIFTDYSQHIDKINKVAAEIWNTGSTVTPSVPTTQSGANIVADDFSTSRNILSERKRKRYIIGYNALIFTLFKGRIRELKAKSVDKVVAHVLVHDIHKRILKFIRGINPFHGIRKLRKLISWKFWKGLSKKTFVGLGKFFTRSLVILPLMMGAGLFKMTVGTGVFVIKTGFSALALMVKLPFKMVNTTCLILKGLLKASFSLVKNSFRFGNNILGKIRFFLFNPIGAYITGFVIGFLWEKVKQLWGDLGGYAKKIKRAVKRWLKKKDDELKRKYPLYDKFRTDIDTRIGKFEKWYDENIAGKTSQFKKLADDLLGFNNAETPEEKEAAREELYKDLNDSLGWDKVQGKIIDVSLWSLDSFNELFGNDNNWFGEFKAGFEKLISGDSLKNAVDMIENFGLHGGLRISAAKTATNVGSQLLFSLVGAALGSALGPIGTVLGATAGSAIGTIIGTMASRWIGDIPFIEDIEVNQVKRINERYLQKNQLKQNRISPKDIIVTKDDKRQKRIEELKEIIQDRTAKNPNQTVEAHSKEEMEELKKLLDKESWNSVVRAMGDEERIKYANGVIERFGKIRDIDKGIKLAYVTGQDMVKMLFDEKCDIDQYLKSKRFDNKFSKNESKRKLQNAKIKFVTETVQEVFKAISENKVTMGDAVDYIEKQLNSFDSTLISETHKEIVERNRKVGEANGGNWDKRENVTRMVSVSQLLNSDDIVGSTYESADVLEKMKNFGGLRVMPSKEYVEGILNDEKFTKLVTDPYNGSMYRSIIRNTALECYEFIDMFPLEKDMVSFNKFVIERIDENLKTYEKAWGKEQDKGEKYTPKTNPLTNWTLEKLYGLAGLNTRDKSVELRKKLLKWVEENGEKNGVDKKWLAESLRLEDIENLDRNIRIKRAQNDYMKDRIEENLQSNPVVVNEEESGDDPISTMEPPEEAER